MAFDYSHFMGGVVQTVSINDTATTTTKMSVNLIGNFTLLRRTIEVVDQMMISHYYSFSHGYQLCLHFALYVD